MTFVPISLQYYYPAPFAEHEDVNMLTCTLHTADTFCNPQTDSWLQKIIYAFLSISFNFKSVIVNSASVC